MPTASPSDVQNELDTTLSDPDIAAVLGRVERDVDREDSPPADGTDDRQDLEAVLAALRIATGNAPDATDRTASEAQSGRTSRTYEASTVAALRQRARFLGASDNLVGGGVRRNTDRHVGAANNSS